MRILHIIDHWGLGGAQRALSDLVRHDDQNHHEIAVIFQHGRQHWPLPQGRQPLFLANSYRATPLAIVRLRRLIRTWQPDCLHVHLNGARFVLAIAQFGRKAGCPTVWHEHSGRELKALYGRFWGGLLMRWQRYLQRQITHVVGNSKSTMNYLKKQLQIPPEKTSLINCMVDSQAIVQLAKNPLENKPINVDKKAFIVGFVGRLATQKGPDVLLEIARSLARFPKKTQLWIVGEGPEGAPLKAALEKEEWGQAVVFWGHREDIYAVMAAMDVLVMPSRFEPFGLVAVEAFVLGKPVIGFAVDGLKEVLALTPLGVGINNQDQRALTDAVPKVLDWPSVPEPLLEHPFLPEVIALAWKRLYSRVGAGEQNRFKEQ
jgi:glycosyltransferase involved in cell wall biosynthesis